MKKTTVRDAKRVRVTVVTEVAEYQYDIYVKIASERNIRAAAAENYRGSYFSEEIIDIIW